jgi:hypothetical protein
MNQENKKQASPKEEKEYPGYPHYPNSEDITRKENNTGEESMEDEDIDEDISGGIELDVPGSGDDNADEEIGEEDEENNYYSLGGDNHEALEEGNED